jgi:hypothetical protein
MAAIAAGVSTRRYASTQEPVSPAHQLAGDNYLERSATTIVSG